MAEKHAKNNIYSKNIYQNLPFYLSVANTKKMKLMNSGQTQKKKYIYIYMNFSMLIHITYMSILLKIIIFMC